MELAALCQGVWYTTKLRPYDTREQAVAGMTAGLSYLFEPETVVLLQVWPDGSGLYRWIVTRNIEGDLVCGHRQWRSS